MTPFETVRLARPDDFEGWRDAARERLLRGVAPETIVWEAAGEGTGDLFGEAGAVVDVDRPREVSEAVERASAGHDTPPASSAGTGAAPSERRVDAPNRPPRVPGAFLELAERVVCHRDPDRFALLYRVLWRLARGETGLISRASDPDVHRLHALGKAVARERHKTHAFVRFRRTPGVEPEHYGAWFEPEYHTLRLSSGFFVRRFANMRWSIVTPEESAHWDGRELVFGPGGRRGSLPDDEAMEALWQTYFASIFNPARLKLDAMRAEMPVKYWKNLPEARLIAPLVHAAGGRVAGMVDAAPSEPPRFAARATWKPARGESSAGRSASAPSGVATDGSSGAPIVGDGGGADGRGAAAASGSESASGHGAVAARDADTPGSADVPSAISVIEARVAPSIEFADLASVHAEAARCGLCEHACRATQAVNGEGAVGARLMLVGEQAGDREDLAGRPFVGPAGGLLRGVLDDLGVGADELFLTNAVRHFRHEPRGKRRLHRTPSVEHVDRCRRFLFEEIRLVGPRVVVALGATAGRALTGRAVTVERERGRARRFADGIELVQSLHPASILRAPDEGVRAEREAALREDLTLALESIESRDG